MRIYGKERERGGKTSEGKEKVLLGEDMGRKGGGGQSIRWCMVVLMAGGDEGPKEEVVL